MAGTPYKKDWLVSTGIARGMISTAVGERLPTLNEYCEAFECSRGVVQNAIAFLESIGAAELDKRGKQGSFLAAKNEELLFENAGLTYLTGSMPTPLNLHLAGLATGICQAMSRCSVPFTFAFVQGGRNRAEALARQVYDFVIVTAATAEEYISENPELERAFDLLNCSYSLPYMLYMNAPGLTQLRDGMVVALDKACYDQYRLTSELCEGRDVKLVEMSYIAARQAFISGEVDALVFRGEDSAGAQYMNNFLMPTQRRLDPERMSVVPIELPAVRTMQQPVVLVNRKNYGIAGILESYLKSEVISFIQEKVIKQQMAPQFF